MKPRRPDPAEYVTDHAVLRYAERTLSLDMEGLRRELLTQTLPMIRAGAVGGTLATGGWAVVRGGRLVTVLDSQPTSASGRWRDEP